MNTVLKTVLSLSCSGSVLILILFLGKRLWKGKTSRQWQYYIWLAAVLRLLLPFGPEASLLGDVYQAVGQAVAQAAPLPQPSVSHGDILISVGDPGQDSESPAAPASPLPAVGTLLADYAWMVWLAVGLGLLLRKITIYQGFSRYIRAGLEPVSDIEILDRLAAAAEQAGVKKPVELCINPLVSSPLLIGFFHPCIVLPDAGIPDKDFQYTVLHELTHYKRRDMFYKWLVQAAVCLHWFNPLVHLMGREINNACEFSCDEAVLTKLGCGSAQDYGKTLLDAMAAVGRYKESTGTAPFSDNKKLLKERLGAIMNFKRKSKTIRFLTGVLTVCLVLGAACLGVSPVSAAAPAQTPSQSPAPGLSGGNDEPPAETDTHKDRYSVMAEKYYETGSLPLFQMAFLHLDEEAQGEWLDRIFADQDIVFMGAAVSLLDDDCAQILHLAETVYETGDIVFFSNLAMHMSDDTLEAWLDRALEDGNWAFQSILFNALDCDDEFEERKEQQEKEWAAAQTAEYGAVGVTVDGKDYYYQGQLVNIFLDIRKEGSFYVLNMNPKGTVHVKIVRNKNGEITGAAYMTEAEVVELFGDRDGPDDAGMKLIPVDLETVAAGETICLGEYTLSEGDRILYDIFAETGNGLQVFFAKDAQQDTVYWSVHNLRQKDEPLKCTANFTFKPPAEPGTYHLFLRAADGALGNVKGSVSIQFAADAA